MNEEFVFLEIVFLTMLSASCAVLLYYYFFQIAAFSFYKPSEIVNETNEPVSIIISARNEYRNLEKNLKAILEQDYPQYEVVVINDCSWDESQKLLEYYQEVYPHLKICKLLEQEKYPTGKKFALTMGIKAAKYEKLLFTDADCKPSSNQWLQLMQGQFANGKEIVLGFSPYKASNNLLNLFIRFETVQTAFFYFSAAIKNNAFMGIGRNLAYTKELFFKNKGYAKHQHILSGDDDLFVNENATKSNVAIQINPNSFTFTESKKTYAEWANQKMRHNTTGKLYKSKDKTLLGVYFIVLMLFYASFFILILMQMHWKIALGIYVLKLVLQSAVYYFGFKKLSSINLIWFLPILDVFYLIYAYVFGLVGMLAKERKIW